MPKGRPRKKKVGKGIDEVLEGTQKRSGVATAHQWGRATFIIRPEYLERIRALSWYRREDQKIILDDILRKNLNSTTTTKTLKEFRKKARSGRKQA